MSGEFYANPRNRSIVGKQARRQEFRWSTPHLDDDGVLNLGDCTVEEDFCLEDHSCRCGASTPWDCYCDPCPLCDDVEFIDVVVPC